MQQKRLFMKSQNSRVALIGLKRTRMSFQNSRVALMQQKRLFMKSQSSRVALMLQKQLFMKSQSSRVALIGLKQLRMRFQNIKSLLQIQLHQLRITSQLKFQQTKNKNNHMHQQLKPKLNFQQLVSKIQ